MVDIFQDGEAMNLTTTYDAKDKSLLAQLGMYMLYHPIVIEASKEHNLNPWIIAGLGSRESQWGLALTPNGPSGTGDFTPRHCVGRVEKFRSDLLPPDGLGYGRGLLQIDFDAHEFARGNDWKDPGANIMFAAMLLKESALIVHRRCTSANASVVIKGYDPDQFIRYGLAAYNAGPLAVITTIREGKDCDSCTTGRDYSADVLNRAGWFEAAMLVSA